MKEEPKPERRRSHWWTRSHTYHVEKPKFRKNRKAVLAAIGRGAWQLLEEALGLARHDRG